MRVGRLPCGMGSIQAQFGEAFVDTAYGVILKAAGEWIGLVGSGYEAPWVEVL